MLCDRMNTAKWMIASGHNLALNSLQADETLWVDRLILLACNILPVIGWACIFCDQAFYGARQSQTAHAGQAAEQWGEYDYEEYDCYYVDEHWLCWVYYFVKYYTYYITIHIA